MTTATVNLLASYTWTGAYNFIGTARLVERKGKCYLILDHWCGGDIEGKCYRAHVYAVPAGRAEEVAGLLRTADEPVSATQPALSNWTYLNWHVLPDLRCYGRQAALKWAASL